MEASALLSIITKLLRPVNYRKTSLSLSLSPYLSAPVRVASRCDYQLNKGALLASIYIYKLIPRSKFHASNSATVLYKSLGMLASRF